jgi:helicase
MTAQPSFHGLFMGVNRHASSAINELRFAEADARALQALFADGVGQGELLLGEAVTREAIEGRFAALADCGAEDVVFVSFSGHGSQSHELVTYDADPASLADSAIPLSQLTDWFAGIPARHLICVLDCCFSGAMGAKVLSVDALARDLDSEAVELERMAGTGRLILTASTAQQPAWEYARYGHGLLSHHLLEALQGPPEVREGDRLPVLSVMEYVTRRVSDTAAGYGGEQEPTIRGSIDGELFWPVLEPGKTWRQAFPEHTREPIGQEVSSLGGYGFPAGLIESWKADIPSLNELQQTAINDYGLLEGEHLLVTAPTSSGKTLIGELAALKGTLDGARALFLLPLKALVNDKHQDFDAKYGGYGIRTIRATGDYTDDNDALMRGQYDICLMTYEKATALALVAPHILDGVGTIVIDEAQMLADNTRGANLEFLLTMLKVRRVSGTEAQLIALSAVIGDSGGLERWLGGRQLLHKERPVPLDEGVLGADGSFRWLPTDDEEERHEPFIVPVYRKGSGQDWIIPLVQRLVGEGEQVIVFRNTKGATVGCASYLANALGLGPSEAALESLPSGDPSNTSQRLREVLSRGVAFHNSDLDRDERLALEQAFRGGDLHVLAATSTLAMGVNTPASTVILAELGWWDGTPYTVAEYKNMIGRAGRLGFTERGRSIAITPTPHLLNGAWQRYVLGRPEDLKSRFLDTDARVLILRVLAAAGKAAERMSAGELIAFLEASWGVFQRRTASAGWGWSENDLAGKVAQLERLDMIARDTEDRLSLRPLGRLAGEAGVDVESIVRVAGAVRSSGRIVDTASALALVQVTAELDATYLAVNSRGLRKEAASWYRELEQRGVSPAILTALRAADEQTVVRRAKRALGALLWIEGVSRQDIEALLMRHHRENAIAGGVQGAVSRTIDLLPTTLRVAELVADQDLDELTAELLLRLQFGIPPEMGEVATALGDRLNRVQYLALRDAGMTSLAALEAAAAEGLGELLGITPAQVEALLGPA